MSNEGFQSHEDHEDQDTTVTEDLGNPPSGSSPSGAQSVDTFSFLQNDENGAKSPLDGATDAVIDILPTKEDGVENQDQEGERITVSETVGGSSAASVISSYESNGWVGVAIENSDRYTIENGEMVTYSASGERSVGDQSGLGPMIGELLSSGHTKFEYTHEGKNRVIITELNGNDIVYYTFEEPAPESLTAEPPVETKLSGTQISTPGAEGVQHGGEGVRAAEITTGEAQSAAVQTAATQQRSTENVGAQNSVRTESQTTGAENRGTTSAAENTPVTKSEVARVVERVSSSEPSVNPLASNERSTDRSSTAGTQEAGKSTRASNTETAPSVAQSELPPAAKVAQTSGIRLVRLNGEAFYKSQAEPAASEKPEGAGQKQAELNIAPLATSLQTFARLINRGPSSKETTESSSVAQASSTAPIKIKTIQSIGQAKASETLTTAQVDMGPQGGGPQGPQGPELGLSKLENADGFVITQTTTAPSTRVQSTFSTGRSSQSEQVGNAAAANPEPNGSGPSNEIRFIDNQPVAETSDTQSQTQPVTTAPAVTQSVTSSERSTTGTETPEPTTPSSGPDAPLVWPLSNEYSGKSEAENSATTTPVAQGQNIKNTTKSTEQQPGAVKDTQQNTTPRSPVTPTSPTPASRMDQFGSSRTLEQTQTATEQPPVTAPVRTVPAQATPIRSSITEQRTQSGRSPVNPSGPVQPMAREMTQINERRVDQVALEATPLVREISAQAREVTRVTEIRQAEPSIQRVRAAEVFSFPTQQTSRVTVLPGQRIRFEQPAAAATEAPAIQRSQAQQFTRPGIASVADDTAVQATAQTTALQQAA